MSNTAFSISKLLLFLMLLAGQPLFGQGGRIQTRPKDQGPAPMKERRAEPDEMVTFKDHLWYGGSFDLGFSGSNSYNIFIIGVNPMVGYKILPFLSVGPRVGIQYNYIKGYIDFNSNQVKKLNLFHYSAGVFTRAKFFRNFFAQAEYEYQSYQDYDPFNNLDKFRVGRDNMYIGLGYNSGGEIGTELALMYNLLEPAESLSLPISLRFGLTYKF
ncbi:MAG: hypothetical protein ABIV51_08830 [Saprospiraceae bacterium]